MKNNNEEPIDEIKIEDNYEKEKVKMGMGKKIFVILSILIISIVTMLFAAFGINQYIILGENETINLVINNKNVTQNLRYEILVEDEIIYISMQDISNFYDQYIYLEEDINKIITTYRTQIAELELDNKEIELNGKTKTMLSSAMMKNDVIYLPISEMLDVYEIEAKYLENTKVVTLDSTNRELIKATVVKNDAVKSSTNLISKTYDRINKGEEVYVISIGDSKSQIRSTDGKIGYINTKSIDNIVTLREDEEKSVQVEGNINLIWDYFSEYAKAPQRTETIEGVNVVSPAFFHVDTEGNLVSNVGDEGINYVELSHQSGYKVWPMVSNAGDGMFSATSEIVNSYEKRKELINQIVEVCTLYDLDGINMDFEYMKEEDKMLYSRLIIELAPWLKSEDLVLSVDVTAPDGSPNWSLCYDRNSLANAADYLVFMAYDQYGSSSESAGPTAAFDWVEANVKKFVTTENVHSEKLILGVPFYTRLWTVDQTEAVIKNPTVSMKYIDQVVGEKGEKEWLADKKQYYVEYEEDGYTKKMWIEDIESLEEKVDLVKTYNLAGIAAWVKGMETDDVWAMFGEKLENN